MLAIPEVTDVDVAFPARGVEIAPPWESIPDEFKRLGQTIVSDLFFGRVDMDSLKLYPLPGVDPNKAWRAIQVVLGCYGLKHQHKEAAALFMLHNWFGAWTYKTVTGDDKSHNLGFVLKDA